MSFNFFQMFRSMEAHFCHVIQNKLIATFSQFISQIVPRNCKCITRNSDFISHKCDINSQLQVINLNSETVILAFISVLLIF